MATLSFHHTGSTSSWTLPSAYHPFRPAGRLAARLIAQWRRWQTEREVEALPFDLRKDIGWPTPDTNRITKQKQ